MDMYAVATNTVNFQKWRNGAPLYASGATKIEKCTSMYICMYACVRVYWLQPNDFAMLCNIINYVITGNIFSSKIIKYHLCPWKQAYYELKESNTVVPDFTVSVSGSASNYRFLSSFSLIFFFFLTIGILLCIGDTKK